MKNINHDLRPLPHEGFVRLPHFEVEVKLGKKVGIKIIRRVLDQAW